MNVIEPPSPAPNPRAYAARLWILLAVLLWSSCGLFAKAPLFADWPLSERGLLLAFWRAAFAGLVLVPMIRRPRWNPWLVPLTLCFTAMCVTYLTAMSRTTAANAIWLQATSPWWVFLVCVLLLREPVARRELIPLGFGFVGVAAILLFELTSQSQDKIGVLCGVGSGITYAAVVVLLRRLRAQNSAWLIGLNHLVASLVLLPWVIHTGVWPSPGQLVVLAGFGAFQMAIPYVLVSRALRTIGSQEVIAICLVEPVLTPLWVFLVWGEVPAPWTIAGASLILVGLLLRYVILEGLAGRRIALLLAMLLVVGLGLGSRSGWSMIPSLVVTHAGDACWALLVFLLLRLCWPSWPAAAAAAAAFGISAMVEVSQLYHAPWIDAVRATRLGSLSLGYGFLWSDLARYAAGVGLGLLAEVAVGRLTRRPPAE